MIFFKMLKLQVSDENSTTDKTEENETKIDAVLANFQIFDTLISYHGSLILDVYIGT